MILIDSDVLIDILRGHPPAVAWVAAVSHEVLAVPGFVMMEVFDGCRNNAEQQRVERIVAPMIVRWPSETHCATALRNFRSLHLSHSLGMLDSLIGETAVELHEPLHTFNVKHFQHVP